MTCPSCKRHVCTRCLYRNDGHELPWAFICFACFIDVPGRRGLEPPGCEHFPMTPSTNVCQSYLWGIFTSDGDRCTNIADAKRRGRDVCSQCAGVIDLMVED